MVTMMVMMMFAASRRLWEGTARWSCPCSTERINWSLESWRHYLPRRHGPTSVPAVRRTPEQGTHVSCHDVVL